VVLPSKDKWLEDPDMIIFHRMMVRHVPATLPLSLVAWPGLAWLRAGFINEELSGDHHHISEQPTNQPGNGRKEAKGNLPVQGRPGKNGGPVRNHRWGPTKLVD
jgi:hypothetical protein